jgi:iron complex transport system permease protein
MRKKILFLVTLCATLFAASVFAGPVFIDPFNMSPLNREILMSVRLPRVVTAMLIGMALGASGAVLQGILRNPLADPYILGISSGAAFLAVAGIVTGFSAAGLFSIPLLAFGGAIITGVIVGIIGYRKGSLWHERLLLAGIGIGFLFNALLMLILSISSNEGLRKAVLWMFGELSMAEWSLVPYGMLFIVVGLCIAVSRAKALNALMLGDEIAWSLGFNPTQERMMLFLAACLLVAASVSLGGTIGFIGLLMPHIVRFTTGTDNRYLIPLSALSGGALLCIADLIGRSILSPMELPSGIITAAIGAPYFLYLIRKREMFGGMNN